MRLVGHEEWVVSLAFSADGTLLASEGFDRCLRVCVPNPFFPRASTERKGNNLTFTGKSRS